MLISGVGRGIRRMQQQTLFAHEARSKPAKPDANEASLRQSLVEFSRSCLPVESTVTCSVCVIGGKIGRLCGVPG
jgi:hypothetical protein